MASGRFLHHGLLQVHGMEKSSSIPACTRGGLGGCRGRGEQRTPQGHKGLGSPGLAQPCVLTEMGFYVTQRWEHGTAALAFSIFVATQASCSIWDLVASSWVPGVGGKRQGMLPAAVPTSHPRAPRQALTRKRVPQVQVREVRGEVVPGLLQERSVSPPSCWHPGGAGPAGPPPTGSSALVPVTCPQPCLCRVPAAHLSQMPFPAFLHVPLLRSLGVVPELSVRPQLGFHLLQVLLQRIREGRSDCQSQNGPLGAG